MGRWILCLLSVAWLLVGCAKNDKSPEIFLPRVLSPEGADLEALRSRYCRGVEVHLDENFLTPENFRSIFDCANYDSSLEGLRPLFTNSQFPQFLRNMNLILGSKSTENLRETLRPWLEEGPAGTSRTDRLLPILAEVIKNPSFQAALPVLRNILAAGENIWRELLPNLASLVYQERFPDNFEDISVLFGGISSNPDTNYATTAKRWASFIKSDLDGKTVAARALDLADRLKQIELPGTTLQAYLDHMNEKGVFVSMYLDSGAVRGEALDPKLNSDPDEDEIRDGLSLTPEQREARAYRKLFARGPNGEDAPIVQLAGMVAEFQDSHPDFLPAISRWFSANGPRVTAAVNEYVVRARVVSNLSRISAETYLNAYAKTAGKAPDVKITGAEFSAFLAEAFNSAQFSTWLDAQLLTLNTEQFGPRNAAALQKSNLTNTIAEIYELPEIANFGATLVPDGKTLALNAAVKRFSNLHRGEKLVPVFRGVHQGLEAHLVEAWWSAARDTLGESVVLQFGVELAQTLVTDMATQFGAKNLTLAEWYFGSPYSNPGSTESVAGYAFKELGLLEKYEKNKDYVKNTLGAEMFERPEDRRAFNLLVDQVPNIWLYLRSGMARSGNDLSRALASKDRGFLSNNYVAILVSAQRSGWIRDGVRLVEAYQKAFPASDAVTQVSDDLESRREVSKGVDALKRVLRSLFEPEEKGNYETSTLGRLLTPLSSIVATERREETETFLLTSADEVLKVPDDKINDFARDLLNSQGQDSLAQRRDTLKATAEFLRDPIFPDVIRELSSFFQDDAVKPALDFLAQKIDDGSLKNILLFLRRVLGFRG